MERLRSRTKSMLVMMDARKSIVERGPKPEPIDPNIAAGGLAPCPAARTKIAMLPTASSVQTSGEPLSGIFSANHNSLGESVTRAPPTHGRRSVTSLGHHGSSPSDNNGLVPLRSASAMEGETQPPWLPNQTDAAAPKYRQHTVHDYQRIMDDFQHIKWGGLGANDNEEKRRARETRKRVQDYGKCVSQLNVQMIKAQHNMQPSPQRSPGRAGPAAQSQPIARKLTKEGELARLKRERALRFAEQLWVKPTSSGPPSDAPIVPSSSPARVNHGRSNQLLPPPMLAQELHALEDRHREDYEKILSIKRQLGILASSAHPEEAEVVGAETSVNSTEEVPPEQGGMRKLPSFLREDYGEACKEDPSIPLISDRPEQQVSFDRERHEECDARSTSEEQPDTTSDAPHEFLEDNDARSGCCLPPEGTGDDTHSQSEEQQPSPDDEPLDIPEGDARSATCVEQQLNADSAGDEPDDAPEGDVRSTSEDPRQVVDVESREAPEDEAASTAMATTSGAVEDCEVKHDDNEPVADTISTPSQSEAIEDAQGGYSQ